MVVKTLVEQFNHEGIDVVLYDLLTQHTQNILTTIQLNVFFC